MLCVRKRNVFLRRFFYAHKNMFDRDKSDDKHFRGLNILMSNSIIRTFDPRASNFLDSPVYFVYMWGTCSKVYMYTRGDQKVRGKVLLQSIAFIGCSENSKI